MNSRLSTIVFGGGCFWCVEAVFQRLRGVKSVLPGYVGGGTDNPTYEQVSSGGTGHVEVIKIDYDSAAIKLADLLAVFFSSHDPTQTDGQGADIGSQYRSAVYYLDEEQKQAVTEYIQKLENEKIFERPIVTEVKKLGKFYAAEDYHRNYYDQNQTRPYCLVVINPKLAALKKQFAHLLK